MAEEEKLNWRIVLIQLLIAIVVVFIVSAMTPQILSSSKIIFGPLNQQVCSNALLQAEMLNNSSSLKETTINALINSPNCQNLFSNNTTNE